ncbi:I78 family peptidase inhibitor [Celeribacter baekdonensis]|uniref:I78 family peptidase inhibitor n=1 Tax=Celeribacter baekdonensis TaxID=875171 RepID=UPI0030D8C63C|tara:strand:- start:48561 stop:48854 length:294 start_codon:yes stop_codon:yes gene_type:complete
MIRPTALALILGAFALSGCKEDTHVSNKGPAPMSATECALEILTPLIGQDKSALDAFDLPAGTRIIPPGRMVTKDFRPERTNIDLDATGRIIRVWCG